VAYIAGHNDRRRSRKWLFAVFYLILATNFLDQISRIDGLKGWLRRTETMLKEMGELAPVTALEAGLGGLIGA